jgi:hypothetical protein
VKPFAQTVQVFSFEHATQFGSVSEHDLHSLPLTYSAAEQFSSTHVAVASSSLYPSAQDVHCGVSDDVITVAQVVHVAGQDRHSPVSVFRYIPASHVFIMQ